jgi:hypothetical protein
MTTRAITMKDQTNDYLIMKLRTLAKLRGATPVEIQNNVNRLWDEQESPTLRDQFIDLPETQPQVNKYRNT